LGFTRVNRILPAVACSLDTIESGGIRLDVEQRSPIQDVDMIDMKHIPLATAQFHDAEPDGIGTAGCARGKYSPIDVLEKGFHHKPRRPAPAEVIDEINM
jgi:hypothetical protein